MFDIGFSELLLIGLVALVVLGPERLPKVARTLGHLLGRAQRYVSEVKSEINREVALDELRKTQAQFEQTARDVQYEMTDEVHKAESILQHAVDSALPKQDESIPQVMDSLAKASPQMELGLEVQSNPPADVAHKL
jgi:sec-independent protein translocase protein TatB